MKNQNNISYYLAKLGMSQKQLAEKAGLAVAALNKIVSGKVEPRIGTAKKIAKALGAPLEMIFMIYVIFNIIKYFVE